MPAPVAVAPAPAAPNAPTSAPANVAPAAPPAAAPPEQFFEVKVGGQVKKFTRAEAERALSKTGFADDVIQQGKEALRAAAQLRKEREEEEAAWKDESRLEELLRKKGVDPDKFSLRKLEAKVREGEMTPHEREIERLKAEAAAKDAKLKEADDEKAQRSLSERSQRAQAHIVEQLNSAWERAGFERNADNFAAVHDVLREWRDIGMLPKRFEDFSPSLADRIVEAARENIDTSFKRLESATLKSLKGEALVKRLGPDIVKEVLRFKVEELRGGGPKKLNGTPAPKPADTPAWVSPQEALKKMRGAG